MITSFPIGEIIPQADHSRPYYLSPLAAGLLLKTYSIDSAAATADPNGRLGGKPQNLRVEPTTRV